MPAITLARLRLQAARLGEKFSQPADFTAELHTLLDFYADRTHRPGKSGEPAPLLQAYHTPAPVLRQVLLELYPLAAARPEQALALCDELWQQNNLECRLLAAGLIGRAPVDDTGPVLQRAREWLKQEGDETLIETVLSQGLSRLRREKINQFIGQARAWMGSKDIHEQQVGLRALYTLMDEPAFDNLPVLYRLMTPWVRKAPPRLRPYIVRVLHQLARRSPPETAYFLRQNLNIPESADTAWAIRQVLHDFPPGLQESLREAMRSQE